MPLLRLGAFDVPKVPGVHGAPVAEVEQGLGMELDGLVGSGCLAAFRVTLVDGGRTMWLEDMPPEAMRRPAPALSLPEGVQPESEPEEPEEPEPDTAAAPAGKKPGKGGPLRSPTPPAPAGPAPGATAARSRTPGGANVPAAAPKAVPAAGREAGRQSRRPGQAPRR